MRPVRSSMGAEASRGRAVLAIRASEDGGAEVKFPDTPLRRGLCDCSICRELRDWWWQAMWMTLMTIAVHHETQQEIASLESAMEGP